MNILMINYLESPLHVLHNNIFVMCTDFYVYCLSTRCATFAANVQSASIAYDRIDYFILCLHVGDRATRIENYR